MMKSVFHVFLYSLSCTNFALSHAERVPNMDLSFRLESSELCWKDTHTILNKNLKCLRLGSARPFSFMLFVVCSTYYIATQWRWIIWGQGGNTPCPADFGGIVSKTFMIAGWLCAQRHGGLLLMGILSRCRWFAQRYCVWVSVMCHLHQFFFD